MGFGINGGVRLFSITDRRIPPELAAKLDNSRHPLEWLMELVAVAGLIVHMVTLAMQYGGLPDILPTHFGFDGQVNSWGGKSTLLFLLAVNMAMYIMMTVVALFPRLFNFPVDITAENAQRQFRLMRGMLVAVKAVVIWMFCYISYQIMAVALGLVMGMGWALWLLMALLMGIIGISFALSYKWR